MSKMFQTVTRTWSPFTGCAFDCTYCWARSLALGRLKNTKRYRNGFEPEIHPEELAKRFKPGEFVGVTMMGDISFAPRGFILDVLQRIRKFPETRFLFCTKNPMIYWHWEVLCWPDNLYLGATIETTVDYQLSKAPPPTHRFVGMKALDHPHKFISIEPVMDFDLEEMLRWMAEIKPEIIEVGADNYNNGLAEPSPAKIRGLLKYLSRLCPQVVEKTGLERVKVAVPA